MRPNPYQVGGGYMPQSYPPPPVYPQYPGQPVYPPPVQDSWATLPTLLSQNCLRNAGAAKVQLEEVRQRSGLPGPPGNKPWHLTVGLAPLGFSDSTFLSRSCLCALFFCLPSCLAVLSSAPHKLSSSPHTHTHTHHTTCT